LIGVVPERRRSPERIIHESIVNLGRKLVGEQADIERIYLVRVNLDDTILRFWDQPHDSAFDRMISKRWEWEEVAEGDGGALSDSILP